MVAAFPIVGAVKAFVIFKLPLKIPPSKLILEAILALSPAIEIDMLYARLFL
jgi:hypothetical protein